MVAAMAVRPSGVLLHVLSPAPPGSQAWLASLSVTSLSHPVSSPFFAKITQNWLLSFLTMHPDLDQISERTLAPAKPLSFIF